jgi:endogenous inhibitor of DNA gyrase (YacG/DUF329 family)
MRKTRKNKHDGSVPCEQCGKPSGVDRETYERVKPKHIFCSQECRTIWINKTLREKGTL